MTSFLLLLVLLGISLLLLTALVSVLVVWQLTHPPCLGVGVAAARGWWLDPGDADLTYREWILKRPKHVQLPVWEIENLSHRSAPIMVMLHEWGGSRLSALQRVPLVIKYVSKVILPESRRHGDAEGGLCSLGTANEVDDLLALLDQLGDERKFVLFGCSIGSITCIQAALNHPAVVGVIADCPHADTTDLMRAYCRSHILPGKVLIPIVGLLLRLRFKAIHEWNSGKMVERIDCPLLILHGRKNEVTSIESARSLVDAAAQAEIVEFPEGHHLDLHLECPSGYSKAIQSFLRVCEARAHDRHPSSRAV